MSTDEFTKLFLYMTKRFDRIDAILEAKADKQDVDRLSAAVDATAKRQETFEHELPALKHQSKRPN